MGFRNQERRGLQRRGRGQGCGFSGQGLKRADTGYWKTGKAYMNECLPTWVAVAAGSCSRIKRGVKGKLIQLHKERWVEVS